MLDKLKGKVLITASKSLLQVKKFSPEILIVLGTVGIVSAAVMACKATTKINEVIEDHEEEREKIEYIKEEAIIMASNDAEKIYAMEAAKTQMAKAYIKTGFNFVKLYGPSVTLGAASISMIIGSHYILKRRNVALMAAYKALNTTFNEYRKRVASEFGEDKERSLHAKVKQEKNGKETQNVIDKPEFSEYARFFDEGCLQHTNDPEYNKTYLLCQQNYANDLLRTRGHVFLNEVYDMLGMERSKAGQVVGWVVGDDGDGYIDFNIFEGRERSRAFVNGYEQSILLDFNVSGVIYDMI